MTAEEVERLLSNILDRLLPIMGLNIVFGGIGMRMRMRMDWKQDG